MTAEVIQFPRPGQPNPYRQEKREPEVVVDAALMAKNHCDETVEIALTATADAFEFAGLSATSGSNEDALLAELALKSMAYRMAGLHHPLHDVLSEILETSKKGFKYI